MKLQYAQGTREKNSTDDSGAKGSFAHDAEANDEVNEKMTR